MKSEEPPAQGGSCACEPSSPGLRSAAYPTGERLQTEEWPDLGRTRVCLRMAYDGGAFSGFAENSGVATVAGELRSKLERIYSQPITLTCAGRTDAGVHAAAQFVTFDVVEQLVEPPRLRKSLNSFLSPSVVVSEVVVVDPRFDARYAALWRSYRYTVLNAPFPDPFMALTSWWVKDHLDTGAMREAATTLLGLHDFSSFCRRAETPNATMDRRLLQAKLTARSTGDGRPEVLHFDVSASAFCHQMVRSIVGVLVDVGRGYYKVDEVPKILEGRSRSLVANVAPAHGLCLWQVGYPGDPVPDWPGARR